MTGVPEGSVGHSGEADAAWKQITDTLPAPTDAADRDDPVWQQLWAQFRWYDRAATRNRYGYQGLRLAALLVGAAVTVLAAVNASPAVTASLAAAVVVAEGAQQLFQFHANWISYRGTAESLRQHAFHYAARVAPYAGGNRRDALAAMMSEVAARENTTWTSNMRQSLPPTTSVGA